MKQRFLIRPMCQADVPQVAALEKKIFSRPWSAESFEKALTYPEQILLVAEKAFESDAITSEVDSADGSAEHPIERKQECTICGYSILFTATDQADVSNIAVDPDCRGQGIGDALMREMLCQAKNRGVQEVFLEVRVSNTPAIGLYQKYGFEQIGVRKGYYEEPKEDAHLMRMGV